jgi:hypothetical protein
MIISVSINGVLRNILSRFEEVYNKYHEEGVTSEVVTPDLLDYTHFKSHEELYKFVYDESPMEIFGQSKEMEQHIITHLTSLYKSMPKDYKLRIIGDDLGRAKSSTLWFLAKYGTSCDEISFYNSTTVNEIWDKTDIFITSDVDIIESKPDNKELIIVNRLYNEGHGPCDMRIDSLKQIKSFEEIYELEE